MLLGVWRRVFAFRFMHLAVIISPLGLKVWDWGTAFFPEGVSICGSADGPKCEFGIHHDLEQLALF